MKSVDFELKKKTGFEPCLFFLTTAYYEKTIFAGYPEFFIECYSCAV